MKISKRQLRKIIREAINTQEEGGDTSDQAGWTDSQRKASEDRKARIAARNKNGDLDSDDDQSGWTDSQRQASADREARIAARKRARAR
jgi:hypothetical protein